MALQVQLTSQNGGKVFINVAQIKGIVSKGRKAVVYNTAGALTVHEDGESVRRKVKRARKQAAQLGGMQR